MGERHVGVGLAAERLVVLLAHVLGHVEDGDLGVGVAQLVVEEGELLTRAVLGARVE